MLVCVIVISGVGVKDSVSVCIRIRINCRVRIILRIVNRVL